MTLPDWFADATRLPGLPPAHPPAARIWMEPTFSPAVSWSFHRGRAACLVRRVVAARNPVGGELEPWGADGRLAPALVEGLLAALAALHLPPFATHDAVGRDGTTFGVQAGGELGGAALSWWESPPRGWEELATLHRALAAAAESALPVYRGPTGEDLAHALALRALLQPGPR